MLPSTPLRVLSVLAVAAVLATGCSLAGAGTVTLPKASPSAGTGTGTGGGGVTGHNLPLEPLAGVQFNPIDAATSQYLSSNGSSLVAQGAGNLTASAGAGIASKASAAAAPQAAGMVADTAGAAIAPGGPSQGAAPNGPVGGAFSGNIYAYYGYNYYFGGFGDQQMSLVSLLKAETPGSAGGFAEVATKVAGPIVKAWAADARLVESSATLDNGGKLASPEPNTYYPFRGGIAIDQAVGGNPIDYRDGWRLTYASSSRTEVLTFVINPNKTTILRMRWEPLNLAPERIATDTGAAISKVMAAIQDKGFASEEEKSGKDYFLNFKYEQPKTYNAPDGSYRTDVLYTVPANARWSASLEEIMGKLVWQLNYYQPASPNPTSPTQPLCASGKVTDVWENNSAQGMVDAETGAVIRFTRPTRTNYTHDPYNYNCNQVPKPTATPVASSTALPSATPVPASTAAPTTAPSVAPSASASTH